MQANCLGVSFGLPDFDHVKSILGLLGPILVRIGPDLHKFESNLDSVLVNLDSVLFTLTQF